jgi:esterase/lipase superfamily enzyme/tetratricopeptide (TPR) repeat protein
MRRIDCRFIEGTIAVSARNPIASIGFFLLLALFSIVLRDTAGAQERWPPWQSYGEAEDVRRKGLRRGRPANAEAAMLNQQIAHLKAAGKYAQAVPLAQKALVLAEKKGADSPDVAKALDTLADLYEAQKQYAAAEPLLKRSLAIREKTPGQPDVAASRERLAVSYDRMGRAAEAKTLRSASNVLDKKSGGGQAADKLEAKKDGAEHKADEQRAAALKAAKAAEEGRAKAAQAEEAQRAEAAKAKEARRPPAAKAAEPAMPPGRQFHARRMVSPSGPGGDSGSGGSSSTQPSTQEETVNRSAKEQTAPDAGEAAEMKPQAAPPLPEPPAGTYGAAPPAQDAGPPGGAFGGAPPPVAEGPPESTEPPPVAEGPAAADDSAPSPPAASPTPPPFDGGRGLARALPPPPLAGEAPPMAQPPPPAKMTASPSGGALAPAAEPDWHVVPVFWGTDRGVMPNAQRLAFGSDRGRKLQLGEAMVTVPKVHEVPNVERPWVVKIPYFDVTLYAEKEDPKSHFTIKEIKGLTKEELLAQVKGRLTDSKIFKDQAVVFVHGYNTSFDNALYRTAQIAYDLDFDGATFLYSWPSGGAVASYTYDRESAQASEPYLREFLEMVVKETGAKSVSIIAHSMGNQPVMDVLRDMRSSAPAGVEISQVILAAPDVDADSFSNLAKAVKGLAKNVTLYVASNDRALIVSRNFWGSYRAGDVPPAGPLILPGIDTIDVTAASTDTFAINHSGYASNNKLLEDIGELLKTGLRPPEMRILKPGKISGPTGDYWRYAPAPP